MSDPEPHLVFLTLGSNIDPVKNLSRAAIELARSFTLRGLSRVYRTEPVGAPGSPVFLNAAALIETGLAPAALKFDRLRPLEARLGRVRTADPNAPRTIDIDIALFGDLVVTDPERGLEIPDPEIRERPHLALPLADLSPRTRLPTASLTLGELADRMAGATGIRVEESFRWPAGIVVGPRGASEAATTGARRTFS